MCSSSDKLSLFFFEPTFAARCRLLGLYVLIALGGFFYILGDYFLSDDWNLLLLLKSASLRDLLGLFLPRETDVFHFIRPLSFVPWWVNSRLWGLDPLGYHLTNVVLHGLNAGLLAVLCRQLAMTAGGAFAAGLIFALSPLNPDAVTWLAALNDPSCVFFYLLSACLLVSYLKGGQTSHLILSLLAFAAALLNKEMALSFPLVATLLAVFYAKASRYRRAVVFYWLIAAGYMVFRLLTLGGIKGYLDSQGHSIHAIWSPALLISNLTWVPLKTIAFPLNSAILGPVYYRATLVLLAALYGAAILWALYHAGWHRRNKTGSLLILGVAWIVLTSTPVFNLLQTVSPDLQNTRYLYLPGAGFAMLLAALLSPSGANPKPKWLKQAVWVVFLVVWTVLLQINNTSWHTAAANSYELCRQIVFQTSPEERKIFVVGDLDTHKGAYQFRNGINPAVNLTLDPEFAIDFKAWRAGGEFDVQNWKKEVAWGQKPPENPSQWDRIIDINN